ncbi:pantetheine-phosphate adenylyltransferase [Candidatus Giovannonibacteria bacterium RIFCSPLOWO2_01_FULL_44_16]|uniref:Phosphopantetheine adenylyltransferase n=1 Tax=Candidatus Giovannonibacteria bacterium RIFCSPLOWO2_01_FULL_44_16 TaxID=1798348 RepID=A0A1F5X2K7_9BACT|nr:MAG: pantetheine-phosphate adenylyltransferase [Candidatus Giovannonibacteria bacterium RIFCSPLOWO2_01_FULL_44_16]
MKKRCVYAGSFDPPTNGYIWMIRRGAEIFDELIVAIGENPDKKNYFSVNDRMTMLRKLARGIKNLKFDHFYNQYLVKYAKSKSAEYILRGIRSESDFGYENTMCHVNSDMGPNIVTVFLDPPRNFADISSSLVRGLVGPEGWEKVVSRYVPPCVLEKLKQRKGMK